MSQTACPHCGSTNSIATAGQRYCADCGQLITDTKPTKKEDKKVQTPKKTQKSVTVSQKAPSKPRKSAPPLNLKAIEEARKTPAASARVSKTKVLNLKDNAPKTRTLKPVIKKAPVKPTVSTVKKIHAAQSAAAPTEVTQPTANRTPVGARSFSYKLALRDAFKSLQNRHTLTIAVVTTLITTICEVMYVSLFAKTGMRAINEVIVNGSISSAIASTLINHLAWAGLLGFFGYLVYHYGLAEIIFRTSRIFDRRNASNAQARRAALGSLAGLFFIDAITWVLAGITLLLTIGANIGFLGTKSLGFFGFLLALFVNVVAIYFWLGIISARHMATYAVVLGQVEVRRAYSTGWVLFNRQFGRIVTGLLVVIAVSFVIALPASILNNAIGVSSAPAILLTTTIATLTQAAIMIIGAVYFLRLYRFVIAQEYDSELGHLLSGRQPQKTHVKRRLITLAIIGVVWVLVMIILILIR